MAALTVTEDYSQRVFAFSRILGILTPLFLSIVSDGLIIKQVVCIYQDLLSTLLECEFYTSRATCTRVE